MWTGRGGGVQRLAGFLLWGGLALFILGVASCGVGCASTIAGGLDQESDGLWILGSLGLGLGALAASVAMLLAGAILKAVASLRGRGKG